MRRKTLLIILAGLGTLVVVLLLSVEHRPFGRSDTDFAVAEASGISRIGISSENSSVILEKDDEGVWMVNGTEEARKSSVLFILKILYEIRIKSPVSPELFRDEITDRGAGPVKVSVYGNGRQLRSFLVYRTQSNPYGNIMKISERAKAYIVYVPGFEGEIGSAFNSNPLFWQSFTIFSHLPSEVKSVKLNNFSDTASSFMLIRKGDEFGLPLKEIEKKEADQSKIKRYISYFTRVPFENWAFDITEGEKSEIESSLPAYEITLAPVEGDPVVLKLWHRYSDTDGVLIRDTDRLWGKTPAADNLFIVRYFDIDPLLKKRSYFFSD